MKKVAFVTLGCKVNQYDTDGMRGLFLAAGYEEAPFDSTADIYVINTCSVTHMGERKSRQLIYRAKKQNEQAVIVVTGCYAQLAPELIAAIEGVNIVIGTNERHQIVSLVEEYLADSDKHVRTAVHNVREYNRFEELPLYPMAISHTRAHLKIQEGCNNFCSYCIIPYTRGKLKSREIPHIVEEANRLVAHGFKELVLTGIHLGAYGLDLPDRPALADVVEALLQQTKAERIRLGSIESVEVSEKLIRLINEEERMCPHLHLPIQSGSNPILKAMNRHYTKEQFITLIEELRERIPDLAVTTDVIAGFPGESDELFEETLETVRQLGFSHIHAFPYSARQGTPAAAMKEQIPEAVKKERVRQLNQVSEEGQERYQKSLIGKTVAVLVEKVENNIAEGFSEQYIRVQFPASEEAAGHIVRAAIKGIENGTLIGEPV